MNLHRPANFKSFKPRNLNLACNFCKPDFVLTKVQYRVLSCCGTLSTADVDCMNTASDRKQEEITSC